MKDDGRDSAWRSWEKDLRAAIECGDIGEMQRVAERKGDYGLRQMARVMEEVANERRRGEFKKLLGETLHEVIEGKSVSSGTRVWPPQEHQTILWSGLDQMEREQLLVFRDAGEGAVLEVPEVARRARGVDRPNRHDKETAQALDRKGLTEKVGRTGRKLIATPKGMPTNG